MIMISSLVMSQGALVPPPRLARRVCSSIPRCFTAALRTVQQSSTSFSGIQNQFFSLPPPLRVHCERRGTINSWSVIVWCGPLCDMCIHETLLNWLFCLRERSRQSLHPPLWNRGQTFSVISHKQNKTGGMESKAAATAGAAATHPRRKEGRKEGRRRRSHRRAAAPQYKQRRTAAAFAFPFFLLLF